MPNATCFLVAYSIVLVLELLRWLDGTGRLPLPLAVKPWLSRILLGVAACGLFTHSLYLLDRIFLSASTSSSIRLVSSWHDWAIVSAWALACSYIWLLLKRRESLIGLFVLPLLLVLVGLSLAVPSEPLGDGNSATLWRLVHGASMTIGTMLVTLAASPRGPAIAKPGIPSIVWKLLPFGQCDLDWFWIGLWGHHELGSRRTSQLDRSRNSIFGWLVRLACLCILDSMAIRQTRQRGSNRLDERLVVCDCCGCRTAGDECSAWRSARQTVG